MTTLETTADRDQYEHARGNAKGWYETIRDLYREDQTELENKRQEELEQEVMEGPLSVQVRSGWHNPGEREGDVEFEILLTTGGPGLRIHGDLDGYGGVSNAELQMQDWGVPWREVWPCEVEEMDECRAALLWYAGHFYFGE